MCWGELDVQRGTWIIPSERTKNARAHVLPLPTMAWEIIEAIRTGPVSTTCSVAAVSGASSVSTRASRYWVVI